jgi:hypothetical protein
MATIHIERVLKVGLTDEHNATVYQASFDKEFDDLILDVESEENIHTLSFPVIVDDEIYLGNDPIYTRFKVRIGDDYSEWFYIDPVKRSDIDDLNNEALESLLKRLEEIKII